MTSRTRHHANVAALNTAEDLLTQALLVARRARYAAEGFELHAAADRLTDLAAVALDAIQYDRCESRCNPARLPHAALRALSRLADQAPACRPGAKAANAVATLAREALDALIAEALARHPNTIGHLPRMPPLDVAYVLIEAAEALEAANRNPEPALVELAQIALNILLCYAERLDNAVAASATAEPARSLKALARLVDHAVACRAPAVLRSALAAYERLARFAMDDNPHR